MQHPPVAHFFVRFSLLPLHQPTPPQGHMPHTPAVDREGAEVRGYTPVATECSHVKKNRENG